MTSVNPLNQNRQTIELAPIYKIPVILVLMAIAIFIIQPWASLPVALLGLFLLLQTVTIRLKFTPTSLEVYRSDKCRRSFPSSEWLIWEIFWQPVPTLFYFKEVKEFNFYLLYLTPKHLPIV